MTPDFTFTADGTCLPYKKRKYAPSSNPQAVQVPYILREEGGGGDGDGSGTAKKAATKPLPAPKTPANKGKKKAKKSSSTGSSPSSSPHPDVPSSLPVERDERERMAASSLSSMGNAKRSRLSPQVSDVQEHDSAADAPPLPSKKKPKTPVVINLTRPGEDLLLLPDGTRLTAERAPGIGWSASEDEALTKIMSGSKCHRSWQGPLADLIHLSRKDFTHESV